MPSRKLICVSVNKLDYGMERKVNKVKQENPSKHLEPSKTRRFFRVGGALGIFLLLMAMLNVQHSRSQLANSLAVLMDQHLHTTYKIVATKNATTRVLFTDMGADWFVKTFGDIETEALADSELFGLADEIDLKYMRRMTRDDFADNKISTLKSSKLYLGDIVLGPGTICASKECAIYVLVDGNEVFIKIMTF